MQATPRNIAMGYGITKIPQMIPIDTPDKKILKTV